MIQKKIAQWKCLYKQIPYCVVTIVFYFMCYLIGTSWWQLNNDFNMWNVTVMCTLLLLFYNIIKWKTRLKIKYLLQTQTIAIKKDSFCVRGLPVHIEDPHKHAEQFDELIAYFNLKDHLTDPTITMRNVFFLELLLDEESDSEINRYYKAMITDDHDTLYELWKTANLPLLFKTKPVN